MTTNGALLVDKPTGWTSHDVVARVRRLFSERRVGHAGTLDPMATGLLVLALGPSTRLLRFAQARTKHYTGTVRLGVATDSLDADGSVVAHAEVPTLDTEQVNALASSFLGPQRQTPPMVSAVHVGGRRLYELAREGVDVERPARDIVIEKFTLTPSDDPRAWDFSVTCSVGTYVRVLLSDLSEKMGTVGHLSALRRVASGDHHVEDAWTLDALAELSTPVEALRPARDLVSSLEVVHVTDEDVARLRRGQRIAATAEPSSADVAAIDGRGELVAVLVRRGDQWQPDLVMVGQS